MGMNDDLRAAIERWNSVQAQLWDAWAGLLRQGTEALAPRSGADASTPGGTGTEAPGELVARLADGAGAWQALAQLSLESWRAAFAAPDAAEDWTDRMHEHARRWMDQTFGAALGGLQGEIDADEQWRRYVAQLQGLGLPLLGALDPSRRLLGGALQGLGNAWPGSVRDGWDVMTRGLGGLAEAPSLGTMKPELQRKMLEGFNAWSGCQVLNHEYQTLRAKAWVEVVQRAAGELAERARREEPVQSLREWMMLWIGAGDDVLMEMYRSEDYLRVQRELLAQTLTLRKRMQEIADLVLGAWNLPTRAELDDAYRVIHELRRDVRALKKAVAAAGLPHAGAPAGTPGDTSARTAKRRA